MFDTKKVISKAEQKRIDAERRLQNQEGFVLWLQKMSSIHQANVPRMNLALENIL